MAVSKSIFEPAYQYKQYESWTEHVNDWLMLLDTELEILFKYKKEAPARKDMLHLKGLAITVEEVDKIMIGEYGVSFIGRVDPSYSELLKASLQHIVSRESASRQNGVFLPLVHVSDAFGLSAFELFCIVLCVALETDRKYEKLFGFIQDDITARMPTVGLAVALYMLLGNIGDDAENIMQLDCKLFKYFMDDPRKEDVTRSRLSRPMRLSERMYSFLTGTVMFEERIEKYFSVEMPGDPPELLTGFDVQQRLRNCVDNVLRLEGKRGAAQGTAFYLYGPQGSGKKLQVQQLFKYIDVPVVMADMQAVPMEEAAAEKVVDSFICETILNRAALCLCNFHKLLEQEDERSGEKAAARLLESVSKHVQVLFILSETEWKPLDAKIPFTMLTFSLDIPNNAERFCLWQRMTKEYKLAEGVDLAGISNKFRFTPGQIAKVLHETGLEAGLSGTGVLDEDNLYHACTLQASHKLEKKATRITPAFCWDDLIIPDDQKKLLREACNQIRYRHIVYNLWGFDKRLPYGRGLSMLFYGPPGTGKTMGAQVMANELKLEMYRVDISQTISKYIGETEKNLREVFDEAAKTSAILFFDEADSLFGKRSEVKDAHDKYANTETSYLLQKMEEYEGITILATNLIQNFDEAYRRRLKFMINFPMPGSATRRLLWQKVFPPEIPMEDGVDFDFLAERFELSGSNIKNIAVFASFLAAAAESELTMGHLLRALKHELSKAGKVIMRQDMGGYGDLLDM